MQCRKATSILFVLTATLISLDGASCEAAVCSHYDGESPGSTVMVHNMPRRVVPPFTGSPGLKGLAFLYRDGRYYISQMECP